MNEMRLPSRLEHGWDEGSALSRLREEYPDIEVVEQRFRGELTIVVPADVVFDVLAFLRDDPACDFDFLTDVTAVHWPDRERPFEVFYLLYSFSRNVRFRVKTELGADPKIHSVVTLWPTGGWLERECYDMFGVVFEGHPDLRRILMPEDYDEWPMRKENPLKS